MDDIDGLLLMTGRLFEFKDTFNEITKKMKKEMKDFDLTERKEFNVRDCCAVYNDGQWKRGMVERVNSQNYQGWCSKLRHALFRAIVHDFVHFLTPIKFTLLILENRTLSQKIT